jgi:hypothetical protein
VWWAGSRQTATIWVGSTFAALATAGDREPLHKCGFGGPVQALDWLSTELTAKKHLPTPRKWQVLLGSGLARPFVFRAPAGLKSYRELCAVAESMVADETMLAGELRLWVSAADATGNHVAVAVDAQCLTRLQDVARSVRARLVSVRPGWALLTEGSTRSNRDEWTGPAARMLIASDPDGVTALAGDEERWLWAAAINQRLVHLETEAWLSRAAMRLQAGFERMTFQLEGVRWARSAGAGVP